MNFKKGKIELWINFEFNTFRYIVDEQGNGEHTYIENFDNIWYKNTVARKYLSKKSGDIFLGYL